MTILKRLLFASLTLILTASFALFPLPSVDASTTTAEPLTLVWQTEFTREARIVTPSDIAVDSRGYVYVSAQDAMHIKVFDRNGDFVRQWGTGGTGEGEFNLSSGIAIDRHDNLYVADFFNRRIQVFDPDGAFLRQWGTEPPAGPASVIVAPDGTVYVDNFMPHEHHIQKFDSEGNLLHQWGATGSGEGEIGAGSQSGPEDLAVDSQGNLYVADRLNHRIQKFSPEGELLAIFGGEPSTEGHGLFQSPLGLAIDRHDNMYVVDIGSRLLQKLDSEGNFIAQWSTDGGDLDAAAIVALDWEANIYAFAMTSIPSPSEEGATLNVILLKKFRQPSG